MNGDVPHRTPEDVSRRRHNPQPTDEVRRSEELYRTWWIERVRAKCIVDERGCWLWQGFLGHKGYGLTTYRSRNVILHRQMYQSWHRVSLKFEEQVCHSCDIKPCCNPDHLWLGTNQDNVVDSVIKGIHYEASRTHCVRGHEFTPENTYFGTQKGGKGRRRSCKTCERLRMKSDAYIQWRREYQRKRRAEKRAKRLSQESRV